jgi:prevent-host-death family protein
MSIEIGAYEAKTKLPELLRGVRAGNSYTITLRGQAIADLTPAATQQRQDAVAAADEMMAFMRTRKPIGRVNLKALLDEGRE